MSREDTILLGDIGGTNARFALLSGGGITAFDRFAVRDFPQPADAIAAYLGRKARRPTIGRVVLAVAGPVEDGRCKLVNSDWVTDTQALSSALGVDRVDLVNDFAAIAWSLPELTAGSLRQLGPARVRHDEPMVVFGPGTGLGVGYAIPARDGGVTAVASEGGHVSFAPIDEGQAAIVTHLRRRFGHVSAERLLSGRGLENIYAALAMEKEQSNPVRQAADITSAALAGTCEASRAALEMFCGMLGGYAGDLALTLGARGGIFIAGGIVPRIGEFLAESSFNAAFESKGRMRGYLAAVPRAIIMHRHAAFIGLQALIEAGQ